MQLPLVLNIGISRNLSVLLVATHGLAASALFVADLPSVAQWTGWGLLAVNLALIWRTQQPIRIRCARDGKLEIWRNQRWHVAQLADPGVILSGCTIMRIAESYPRRLKNLVILSDSMASNDFRQLRVWLRWLGSRQREHDESDNRG